MWSPRILRSSVELRVEGSLQKVLDGTGGNERRRGPSFDHRYLVFSYSKPTLFTRGWVLDVGNSTHLNGKIHRLRTIFYLISITDEVSQRH